MRKLERSNPRVTCGSCRQFDGFTWCRRWNYHTASDAPICGDYRPIPQSSVPPLSGQGRTVTG
ncbi:MAG: hypothetical protein JF888_06505 [Candidatus Dormibacteraeota bacterium]|uniref:Uncharacterized protein n=1 Tax=Candidatus Dormiibacter inghamiae TaxID=3127013 RepID=A0A934KA87_9BACT|nr:hypothetical protein [Candidatus Dormibacteraeota bacterium]MBJ7606636.1 hypothetical protein [Candidatus Dormibacteraeota bacterium]